MSDMTLEVSTPMNPLPIATPRLVLRAPHPADAVPIAAMMTPAISRGLGAWPVPFTLVMAAGRIEAARCAEADGLALTRVIERITDGALLGWIGVSRSDPRARLATLGYWLGETHHGQGFMREAAPAMIGFAFGAWEIDVIEASTHPGNLTSAAILRVCGMLPKGERTIFAPARQREELCLMFAIARPGS